MLVNTCMCAPVHMLCFVHQVCAYGSLHVHVYKLIWSHVFEHMCDRGYMDVHVFVSVYMWVLASVYMFLCR